MNARPLLSWEGSILQIGVRGCQLSLQNQASYSCITRETYLVQTSLGRNSDENKYTLGVSWALLKDVSRMAPDFRT